MKRKPRPISSPMLVTRTLVNTNMELKERAAVNAFSMGYAQKAHFDILTQMMNILLVAGGSDPSRAHVTQYIESAIKPTLESIRDRYYKTGKMGVNAAEMRTLREFVNYNLSFWLRQTTKLFNECCQEVEAFEADLIKRRKTA